MHDQIAWYFEDEVPNKEDAGPETIDRFREVEIAEHLKLGKTYVNPIKVGDHVTQTYERH